MSDWKPLMFSLIGIFVIAGVLQFAVIPFVDIEAEAPEEGILATLITFIDEGVTIEIPIPIITNPELDFNIFSVFGENIQEFLVNQLIALSLLPTWVTAPLSIVVIIGMMYSIIKLAPTT